MNTEITGGIVRHMITVVAGSLMANGAESLDEIFPVLLGNIASGDPAAIGGSMVALFAVLWSMWVKITEQTKQEIVQACTMGKVEYKMKKKG